MIEIKGQYFYKWEEVREILAENVEQEIKICDLKERLKIAKEIGDELARRLREIKGKRWDELVKSGILKKFGIEIKDK